MCSNTKENFSWKSEKMNVKFHKNCDYTGKILKISRVRFTFVKFEGCRWCDKSLALGKCKKECNILSVILVQDFCPLKIKITQCPSGFHLKFFFYLQESFVSMYTVFHSHLVLMKPCWSITINSALKMINHR